jgi:hypothetical protein
MRVDFPAPFWPIRPCTCPGARSSETWRNAGMPSNCLEMARSSSKPCLLGIGLTQRLRGVGGVVLGHENRRHVGGGRQ